jgi:hypothetical protein
MAGSRIRMKMQKSAALHAGRLALVQTGRLLAPAQTLAYPRSEK